MKKYSSRDIRKLTRVGRASYAVVIPKDMVKKLGWRERQKLQLRLRGGAVIIKDAE